MVSATKNVSPGRLSTDQSGMRRQNLELLLGLVLASPEGVSRADLARSAGITRSTASRLVQDLLDLRLIEEKELQGRGEPGRPATPLVAAPGTYAGIGATVNVDYLSVRAVDLQGNIVVDHFEGGDFRRSDPQEVLREVGRQVTKARALCEDSGLRTIGVGLGLPGLIDRRSRDTVLQIAPNLGWRQVVPAQYLGQQALEGVPLIIDNDANLQAIAAAYRAPHSSRNLGDLIYVSGDIGVGSAIMIDGSLYRGVHGWAGELGHTVVDPAGPNCTCGSRGCLETYVGKAALYRAAGIPDAASNTALIDALESGDERAAAAVGEAGRALGMALSNAMNLLDITTVVLGTQIARIAEWLRPEILAATDARLLSHAATPVTLIGVEPDDAPASTGAAYLALEGVLAAATSE